MSAKHPLGLKPAEYKAITDCMWARSVVPNGHFLPAFGRMAAHGRMVKRGFMTEVSEAEKGMSPPSPSWRVFKITDDNIRAYNAALSLVLTDHRDLSVVAVEKKEGKPHEAVSRDRRPARAEDP